MRIVGPNVILLRSTEPSIRKISVMATKSVIVIVVIMMVTVTLPHQQPFSALKWPLRLHWH